MALRFPSYPNPYSAAPLVDAYGWISTLAALFARGEGRLVFSVHPGPADAAAGLPPIDALDVAPGQAWYDPTTGAVAYQFPSLAQIVADNQAHFDAIEAYLYAKAKAIPAAPFAGSGDWPAP